MNNEELKELDADEVINISGGGNATIKELSKNEYLVKVFSDKPGNGKVHTETFNSKKDALKFISRVNRED